MGLFKLKNKLLSCIFKVLFFLCFLFGQDSNPVSSNFSDFQVSSKKFFTDESGAIRIFVNVWGHVGSPGLHEVYDGIDFATLISVVGGPLPGAELSDIKIYRQTLGDDKKLVHTINLDPFIDNGDRSHFVKILPNDTIIIKQTKLNYILSKVNILNTFLNILNLYVQIERK
jgi:hypothetical protein